MHPLGGLFVIDESIHYLIAISILEHLVDNSQSYNFAISASKTVIWFPKNPASPQSYNNEPSFKPVTVLTDCHYGPSFAKQTSIVYLID